jgi:hypothetical protein
MSTSIGNRGVSNAQNINISIYHYLLVYLFIQYLLFSKKSYTSHLSLRQNP